MDSLTDISPGLVRVKLSDDDLSFDIVKSAIYNHARNLLDKNLPSRSSDNPRKLLLSKDLFEILNRRLVFKTLAHNDLPHFITPYGNLEIEAMEPGIDEPLSFIIA